MSTSLLQLRQVSVAAPLGSSNLLRAISFEVFRRDRIAIVGPTGAGKTTLLRLLNRLIDPSEGSLELEGQNYQQIPVLSLRRQIVLVPQESLLLDMSVQAAIAYPLQLQQLPNRDIKQRLLTVTDALGIPAAWLERTEVQLSLGQRQLVAIARGLVMEPRILLLDEPTSALDAGTATRLFNYLNVLNQAGLTIIMVNHQLEWAESFSRLLYLQKGQLLRDSPAAVVNWQQLRETLIAAQAQTAEDWGE
ncbi:MAG: ATP-binding cassette domain-containing protein [Chloroflexaceae bacterium]|nr:ATP-binding cassette domain-containing protein [Chloroflexaceae bacterium]